MNQPTVPKDIVEYLYDYCSQRRFVLQNGMTAEDTLREAAKDAGRLEILQHLTHLYTDQKEADGRNTVGHSDAPSASGGSGAAKRRPRSTPTSGRSAGGEARWRA